MEDINNNDISNNVQNKQFTKSYIDVKRDADKFIKIYYYKYLGYLFDIILFAVAIGLLCILYLIGGIILAVVLQAIFALALWSCVIHLKFWKNIYLKMKNYEFFNNLTEQQINYILERHYRRIVKKWWYHRSPFSMMFSIYAVNKWTYEVDYLAVIFEEKGFAPYEKIIDLHSYVSPYKRRRY